MLKKRTSVFMWIFLFIAILAIGCGGGGGGMTGVNGSNSNPGLNLPSVDQNPQSTISPTGQNPNSTTQTTTQNPTPTSQTGQNTFPTLPQTGQNPTTSPPVSSSGNIPLASVTTWACQLQNLDASGAVAALAGSKYDLLVLEPMCTSKYFTAFDTKGMVNQLKATYAGNTSYKKLVIAYIDIGEAEDWLTYWTWSTSWPSGSPMPSDWPTYIVNPNAQWVGDYPVAYWDSRWKNTVIYNQNSLINEVINNGFDGIFMDCVDSYEVVGTRAQQDGKDAATEMVNFISEIRSYTQSKKPGFILIQQNASDLGIAHPELLSQIDVINQESVWYTGGSSSNWTDTGSYDVPVGSAAANSTVQNLKVYLNGGKRVFTLDYAVNYAGVDYANSRAQGFVPYCSRSSLANLSTTPSY